MRFAVISFFILFASLIAADLGPKPDAYFNVSFEGEKISGDFEARMLSCGEKAYSDPMEADVLYNFSGLSIYNPANNCYWTPHFTAWGGKCKESQCSFTYFLPDEFKISVYLPSEGKLFVSNEAKLKGMKSYYSVDLKTDGTAFISSKTFSSNSDFVLFPFALLITLAVELLIGFLIAWFKKWDRKILQTIVLANVISLPIVWFVFPAVFQDFMLAFLVGELFAFAFEGAFYFYREKFTLKRAVIYSAILNISSLSIGVLVAFFLAIFGLIY